MYMYMQYMSGEMAAMQSPPAYPSPGANMANYQVAMYPPGRHYAIPPDKRELLDCICMYMVKGRRVWKYIPALTSIESTCCGHLLDRASTIDIPCSRWSDPRAFPIRAQQGGQP